MSVYKFCDRDRVLLLGEGNFSFSTSLIDIIAHDDFTSFSNVISTCIQDVVAGETAEKNVQYLTSKGVKVLFGVDATSLHLHPALRDVKFDKVIFNFPHVGGKMKIHLNRKLLSEFFSSSSKVLNCNGVAMVALCAGQGGTEADLIPRRWDDTWKVVEMAAHGDLVLVKTEPFPVHAFPNYVSVGYKGGPKSFNTLNSLVYVFEKTSPLMTEIDEAHVEAFKKYTCRFEDVWVKHIHYVKLKGDVFSKTLSPQNFVFEFFCESINFNFGSEMTVHDCELPLVIENSISNNPTCFVNGRIKHLRSSLIEVLPPVSDHLSLFRGVSFTEIGTNLSIPYVKSELCLTGNEAVNKVKTFIFNIFLKFGHEEDRGINGFFKVETISDREVCLVDVDSLCLKLFRLEDWRQLWTGKVQVDPLPVPIIRLPSLYPCSFTFDITFASEGKFSEKDFTELLIHISDDMIKSLELLNVFYPPDEQTENYCFRIVYKSYTKPLYRKNVIDFHHNVLGKSLEKALNVTVL